MHRGIDTGQQVGGDHAAKQGRAQAGRSFAHGLEVVFFSFGFKPLLKRPQGIVQLARVAH